MRSKQISGQSCLAGNNKFIKNEILMFEEDELD